MARALVQPVDRVGWMERNRGREREGRGEREAERERVSAVRVSGVKVVESLNGMSPSPSAFPVPFLACPEGRQLCVDDSKLYCTVVQIAKRKWGRRRAEHVTAVTHHAPVL